jgi:hypothetical protein
MVVSLSTKKKRKKKPKWLSKRLIEYGRVTKPCHIFVIPPFGLCWVYFFISRVIYQGCFLFIFKQRGALMGEKCDWPCWESMNCDASKKCPAKTRPETPCWEIARENDDYMHILQICVDCIVHMLKGENATLSENEIQSILLHKANCALVAGP